jgi:fatty-acyl-CoA synthase
MRAPLSRTLFDLLAEQSVRYSDATAVVSRGQHCSYSDLFQRAGIVASALRKCGVQHGDRIGVLLSNRLEWLEVCLGAGAVGASLVPLSTWSTRKELEFLLADSGVKIMIALARFGGRDFVTDLAAVAPEIAEGRCAKAYPTLEQIVLVDAQPGDPFRSYNAFLADASEWQALPPGLAASAGDDGLILYTSGSSATPKAVRLRLHGIVENGFNIGERMGLSPSDRVLLSAPLFWSYGSANALPAVLTHGATLVLQEKFDAAEALDLVERHSCTAIYTLPVMTAALLAHPAFNVSRVRTLRTGLTIGSPREFLDAAEKLGISELCNVYGATETYGNCCVTWHHWPIARRAACQGEPLPGVEMRFVDAETGKPVAAGEAGLVEVRGYVSPGYTGASTEQNAAVYTADGFYRTGDIGRLDESGAFVFVGRSTEMIKRAGINVSPAEVENILLTHPAVREVGVVGASDRERGEIIVAFVVVRDSAVTAEDLIAHCKAISSRYKVPDRIEIRQSLPATPTGKLHRRGLKQDAADLVSSSRLVPHG